MRAAARIFVCFLALALPFRIQAQDTRSDGGGEHQAQHAPEHGAHAPSQAAPRVGMDEKLGAVIAGDVVMTDENGRQVNVKDLVTMPTILAPVYYSCPNDCNVLLGSLSQALPKVGLDLGRDFQVIAVSFDDRDTPQIAKRRKNDFLTAMGPGFPAEHWLFLTGDQQNIDKLMDSVGFRFQRDGAAFKHPVALIALTPSGKVARYLYGALPMPFDIAMAATEAGSEKVALSVKRAVAFCYSYDPAGRKYVFNFMRVAAVGILAGLALFAAFLVFGGKKRRDRR